MFPLRKNIFRAYSHHAALILLWLGVSLVNWLVLKYDTVPLAYDEGSNYLITLRYYYYWIQHFTWRDLYTSFHSISSFYPPLFFLIQLPVLFLFGRTPDVAVMGNSIFILLLIYSVYGIGKRLNGRCTGILAAFLIVLMPGVFGFSRTNFAACALTAFVCYAFYWLLRTEFFLYRRASCVFGCAVALALLAKQTAIMYFAGPLAILLFALIKRPLRRDRLINMGLALFICSSIAGLWYIPNLVTGKLFTTPVHSNFYKDLFATTGSAYTSFEIGEFFKYGLFLIKDHMGLFFSTLLLLIAGSGVRKKYGSPKYFLWAWFLIPIVIFTLLPTRESRYLLPVLPAAALIIAFGIRSLFSVNMRRWIVGFVGVVSLVQFTILTFPARPVETYDLHNMSQRKRHGIFQPLMLSWDENVARKHIDDLGLKYRGHLIQSICAIPSTPLASAIMCMMPLERDARGNDTLFPYLSPETMRDIYPSKIFLDRLYHDKRIFSVLRDADILLIDTRGYQGHLTPEDDPQRIKQYIDDLQQSLTLPSSGMRKVWAIPVGSEQLITLYMSSEKPAENNVIQKLLQNDQRKSFSVQTDLSALYAFNDGDMVLFKNNNVASQRIAPFFIWNKHYYGMNDFLWASVHQDAHGFIAEGKRFDIPFAVRWEVRNEDEHYIKVKLYVLCAAPVENCVLGVKMDGGVHQKHTSNLGEGEYVLLAGSWDRNTGEFAYVDFPASNIVHGINDMTLSFIGGVGALSIGDIEDIIKSFSIEFALEGKVYNSRECAWKIERVDQHRLIARSWQKKLGVTQELICDIDDTNTVHIALRMCSAESRMLDWAHLKIVLPEEYTGWASAIDRGFFKPYGSYQSDPRVQLREWLGVTGPVMPGMLFLFNNDEPLHCFSFHRDWKNRACPIVMVHSQEDGIFLESGIMKNMFDGTIKQYADSVQCAKVIDALCSQHTLKSEDISLTFYDGSAVLDLAGEPLTDGQGITTSFTCNDVTWHSTQADWVVNRPGPLQLSVSGRFQEIGVEQELLFEMTPEKQLVVTMSFSADEAVTIEKAHFEMRLNKKYTQEESVFSKQDLALFPSTDLIERKGFTTWVGVEGQGVPGVIVDSQSGNMLSEIFSSLSKGRVPKRVAFHSGKNKISVGNDPVTVFSGMIYVYPEMEVFENICAARKKTSCVEYDGTKVIGAYGKLFVFAGGQHAVFHSELYVGDEVLYSRDASWVVERVSDTKIAIKGVWEAARIKEVWDIEVLDDMTVSWQVRVGGDNVTNVSLQKVVVEAETPYTKWETVAEAGNFLSTTVWKDMIFKRYHSPLIGVSRGRWLRKGVDKLWMVLEDPGMLFAPVLSYAGNRRQLGFYALCGEEKKGDGSPYMSGKIIFEVAGNPVNHVLESARTHARNVYEKHIRNRSIMSDPLSVIFNDGAGDIVWMGRKLTTGFGMYTSLFIDGVWQDSTKAVWTIVRHDPEHLVMQGKSLYVPLVQTWDIMVREGRFIDWQVQMELLKPVRLGAYQLCVMLDSRFQKWESADDHTDTFPAHYDDAWHTHWTSMDGAVHAIHYNEDENSDLCVGFSAASERRAGKNKILTTDRVFSARVLQVSCECDKDNNAFEPGIIDRFYGTIEVDTGKSDRK